MKSWPALLLLAACSAVAPRVTAPRPPQAKPYVLVLGTAQDAGLPQIGCLDTCCETTRSAPDEKRLVASLLIVDPINQRRWLVDATPDIGEQVEAARGHPPGRAARLAEEQPDGRPPLFEGLFLTHAHMGHYTGLAQLGREAYASNGLPVHGTPSMGHFLSHNGPWSQLVDRGGIVLQLFNPGAPVVLSSDPSSGVPTLTVTAIAVPHRQEYSDTVGYVIEGPSSSLLYIPDIDKWEHSDPSLEELLSTVDVALVDGSFYADGEIPGRSMADIPHPFISETLALLNAMPGVPSAKVVFTHLNHTNPAARRGSDAQQQIEAAGAGVAREGDIFEL